MDLLLKLDYIQVNHSWLFVILFKVPLFLFFNMWVFFFQGRDSMIRDGKRSISKDLVRFLEFIDGIALKRHGLSFKAMKNMNLVIQIVTKEGF